MIVSFVIRMLLTAGLITCVALGSRIALVISLILIFSFAELSNAGRS